MEIVTDRLRVLVTGAFGHIGSRVVARLADEADLDLLLAARSHRRHPFGDAEVVVGDLSDPDYCHRITRGCTTIVHLAGPSDREVVSASGGWHLITANLLHAARSHDVQRFVHMSSIHVFGSNLRQVVSESTIPSPSNGYGETHLRIEQLIHSHDARGMSRLTLRCTNGFGAASVDAPRSWSLVSSDLCAQAVAGSTLQLLSHGEHERDFIPLTDIADAVAFYLRNDVQGLVLLASGQSVTLRGFADLVAQRAHVMFGRTYRVLVNESDFATPIRYQVDITKLRATGYVPRVDLNGELDSLLLAAARRMEAS